MNGVCLCNIQKGGFMRTKQKELLLKLRSMLVGKMHVQPYIVYDDETIERLLDLQPKTLNDLKQIKGFPEKGKRFKGFGVQVVAIFNDTNSISDFDLDATGSIKAMPKKMIL